MNCFQNNMSMLSTYRKNMSMILGFIDTSSGRVDAIDIRHVPGGHTFIKRGHDSRIKGHVIKTGLLDVYEYKKESGVNRCPLRYNSAFKMGCNKMMITDSKE